MDTVLNAVAEEQLQVEGTDDSCRVDSIEIVPLTRDTDGSCTTESVSGDWFGENAEEDLADLKQEPDDVCGYLYPILSLLVTGQIFQLFLNWISGRHIYVIGISSTTVEQNYSVFCLS